LQRGRTPLQTLSACQRSAISHLLLLKADG
jgi:hypothetical protein